MIELTEKYLYVILYFSSLFGFILFLCIVLGGLYFILKTFEKLINTIFDNSEVNYKEND